jgi:membrane-bound ClpP family serine protease
MGSSNLWLAYVLIAVGLLLLGAELFFPSGVMLALAVSITAIGVALSFAHDTTTGVITLICVLVSVPSLCSVLVHYWPRTRFGQRFFLPSPEEEDDATVATMPVNQELERLRGRYGRAATALRPAGITDFDGKRVDTITEGLPVEPGQWVRCIDVQAGRVIVRPTAPPNLGDLETAIFK